MKATATVTSKGQITVPKPVREALGIHAGDVVEFEVKRGKIEVRNARPAGWSAGLLKDRLPKNWKAPTVEEMNEGIARAPDLFPDLMANAIQRRDINQWAATQGIKVERGEKRT